MATHQVIISIVVQSSFALGISLYRSYLDLRYRAAGTHQAQIAIMDRILLVCSDIQGILGLSILIASLSEIHRISLYHSFIAWHLVIAISLSHLVSVHYTLNHGFRYIIPRLFIIFTTLWMFCAFGVIIWHRHLHWADKPGWCYRSAIFPRDPHEWFAHMAISVFIPIIYCSLYAAIKIDPFATRLSDILTKWPSLRRWWIVCTSTFHFLVFVLVLLGIFSVYGSSRPLLVADNGQGEREQEQWGFGQIIAMLSVLAIAIETYKIFNGQFVQFLKVSFLLMLQSLLHRRNSRAAVRRQETGIGGPAKDCKQKGTELGGPVDDYTRQDTTIPFKFRWFSEWPSYRFGRVATNGKHRASSP
jgi:hypothetical protein